MEVNMTMLNSENIAVDRSRLADYDSIRRRLFLRLVNPLTNRTSILNSPHTPYLDLQIVYHILIEDTDEKVASVRIDNPLFEQYGIPLEKLHSDALLNSTRLFPSRVLPVSSLLYETPENKGWQEDPAIICITNTEGMYGATTLLYPGTLKNVSVLLNNNLYIIPSSIDEVIAVPDSVQITPDKMKEILKDVNRNLLRCDQRLSDHLYYYDRRSNQLMAMV